MPLRDHFRPPLDNWTSWDSFHGAWPAMIVQSLQSQLPQRYVAGPHIHWGSAVEVDVGTFERDDTFAVSPTSDNGKGGTATLVWSPTKPTFTVSTELPEQDEYEVLVYDTKRNRRLVAAVQIVSPANKDRPDHRRAFVGKCAALLRESVSVCIIDLVTTRGFNFYAELLDNLGQSDPSLGTEPSPLYAVASRWASHGSSANLETWAYPLVLGEPLPTLPLWLAEDLSIPLELEASYEETCRILRIP